MILGVPLIFQAILLSDKVQSATNLSHIKNCFVGGDNIPRELTTEFNKFLKKFYNIKDSNSENTVEFYIKLKEEEKVK